MDSIKSEYMNEKELSELLSVSVATLRLWRSKEKVFPFVKLERRVLYKRSVIDKYIEENTKGG